MGDSKFPRYILAAALCPAGMICADEILLSPIEVVAPPVFSVQYPGDTIYTGSALTEQGRRASGAAGRTNVYANLDLLPGVDTELTDPYGLGATVMRIRGVRSQFVGLSIDGLPNYGIMPIGPRENLYDFENIESLALYKGMAPLAIGSAVGNRGGAIAMSYRRPAFAPGALASLAFGSDAYQRAFVRLDTGTSMAGIRGFLSASYTDADNWKGAGSLGPRRNVSFGLSQSDGIAGANLDLFFNATNAQTHDLRPLTFEQARAVRHTRDLDHSRRFSGEPALDRNFYDFYFTQTENRDLLGIANRPFGTGALTLRPYLSTETAQQRNGLQDQFRDLDRYGLVAEYIDQIGNLELSTGYWWESANLEKAVRRMAITPTARRPDGWVYLADNQGRGSVQSPYLQVGQTLNRLRWQAGVKYFRYEEPASIAYRTDSSTPGGWSAALRHNLAPDPDLSLRALTFDAWSPSIGASWQLDPAGRLEAYANYGRNYMRPYAFVPVTNIYASNRAAFKAQGLVLQDLFDTWKMETSDNVDLGLRWTGDRFELSPTLFYAQHHDLLSVALDPTVGLNYHQNVGGATAKGVELLASYALTPNLVAYLNPTYLSYTFDDDLARRAPTGIQTLSIAGNQVPDTPRWMLRAGLIFEHGPWQALPVVRYVGKRYGDPLNTQPVAAYWLLDLAASWTSPSMGTRGAVRVGLEINNLFDEQYIGAINAQDDGSGTVGFYAGPPRSLVLSLSVDF
ncbi:hypothetical protein CKO25_15845 [Thiocapsa imhoffii]|uniref:Fork-head domain-containing protein n=1 Tax=Thiocapsa imhoffii TaxID=382777 RepID=A0A9X0WK95_9GAMM|nr:TonB-dependent receptor [Thiocapsa imhoffii]MBK1646093.1 hypothetical protein [Thiocapsa imhoffii]